MQLMDLVYRIFHRQQDHESDKKKIRDQKRVEQALADKIIQDARRHRATTTSNDDVSKRKV